MNQSEGQKYHCGCGKSYASYPAYSTHKRLKHHNHHVDGTLLPKQFNPKRGRPSFSLPTQPNPSEHRYASLTLIEVVLLKLEEKYGKVLSESDSEGAMDGLFGFKECQKSVVCKTGEILVQAVKSFSEVILSHTLDNVGLSVCKLLVEITMFLVQNIRSSQVRLEWQQKNGKIDTFLFNSFFSKKGSKEKANQLAKQAGKQVNFMLQIVVALSEYLCKWNILDSKLALKGY